MVRLLKFESFLNESSNSVIDLVKDLAIRLHGDQKRKYSGDPYYTHLFRVSDTVKARGVQETRNIVFNLIKSKL